MSQMASIKGMLKMILLVLLLYGLNVLFIAPRLTYCKDTFPDTQHSILAHRIVAQVYQDEEDLANAVTAAENGLELVRREEQNRGIKLPRCVPNTSRRRCCQCTRC